MNKLNKVGSLFASITLVAAASSSLAQTVDNWRATDGTPWRSGADRSLCWRDGFWTPETGLQGCDGVPPPPEPKAPPPVVTPAVVVPAPVVVAPTPTVEKVTYSADTFFDFDKAKLKPEGIAKLDELVKMMTGMNLEAIVATGHTDAIGSVAYNQKLSVKRANAVKQYLVGKGVDASRVYAEGKGKAQPIADNRTAEGRAKNRRVEIEIVGTRVTVKTPQ